MKNRVYSFAMLVALISTSMLLGMEERKDVSLQNDELDIVGTCIKELLVSGKNTPGATIQDLATKLKKRDPLSKERIIGGLGWISQPVRVHHVNDSFEHNDGDLERIVKTMSSNTKEDIAFVVHNNAKNIYAICFEGGSAVQLHRLRDKRYVLHGSCKPDTTDDLACMDVSHDGNILATVHGKTEPTITLWDVATCTSLYRVNQIHTVYRITLSHDKKRLALLLLTDERIKKMDMEVWYLSGDKDTFIADKQHTIFDVTEHEKFKEYYVDTFAFDAENNLVITDANGTKSLVHSLSCAATIEQALLIYLASQVNHFSVSGYKDSTLTELYKKFTALQKKAVKKIVHK